jgi:hypothetical protein
LPASFAIARVAFRRLERAKAGDDAHRPVIRRVVAQSTTVASAGACTGCAQLCESSTDATDRSSFIRGLVK